MQVKVWILTEVRFMLHLETHLESNILMYSLIYPFTQKYLLFFIIPKYCLRHGIYTVSKRQKSPMKTK